MGRKGGKAQGKIGSALSKSRNSGGARLSSTIHRLRREIGFVTLTAAIRVEVARLRRGQSEKPALNVCAWPSAAFGQAAGKATV